MWQVSLIPALEELDSNGTNTTEEKQKKPQCQQASTSEPRPELTRQRGFLGGVSLDPGHWPEGGGSQ